MKKSIFFSALFALVFANIFVYSCRKENPGPTPSTIETGAADRSLACPQVNIGRGDGLRICGVTGPATCDLCGAVSNGATVVGNAASFALPGTTFTLHNPTANAITVFLGFNCVTQNPTPFVIPPGATVAFSVAPDLNGCCQATVIPC